MSFGVVPNWYPENLEIINDADAWFLRARNRRFVSAGDSTNLIDHFPFVLERKRLSTAVHAVDHQIVVAANRAREHEALDSGGDEFAGQFHRRAQIVLVETGRP